ncbi:hypothetical protein SASPL_131320 [Salvia splendens]|uniref:Ras-related protein Rab-18 n=1 Tax=Salvia splendens TaxID=180675 RepID=A0A8X8X5Q8_SALSN|nr:hypothetical protein SASPL_131320 [Salvia splendens]
MESSSGAAPEFDYLFKLLMIGDSGVGKSSLLLSFTSDAFEELSPTIGVDFKERFGTLTSSYYRVYDATRQDTFTNLSDIWAKEIDLHSTNQDCIKMLVGNKVDKGCQQKISIGTVQGNMAGFIEYSAKTRVNVEQCFEELVLKILDTPSLLAEGLAGNKKNIFKQKPPESTDASSSCC